MSSKTKNNRVELRNEQASGDKVSEDGLRSGIEKFISECRVTKQEYSKYKKGTERKTVLKNNIQKEINHKPPLPVVRNEVELKKYKVEHRNSSLEVFRKKSKACFVSLKGHLGVSSFLILNMSEKCRKPDLVYVEWLENKQKEVKNCKLTAEWHWTGKDFTQVRKNQLKSSNINRDVEYLSVDELKEHAFSYLNGGDST